MDQFSRKQKIRRQKEGTKTSLNSMENIYYEDPTIYIILMREHDQGTGPAMLLY